MHEEVCAGQACKWVVVIANLPTYFQNDVCADYLSKGCRARALGRLSQQYKSTLVSHSTKSSAG